MTSLKKKDQMMTMTLTQGNIKKPLKSFTMPKRYANTMFRASVTTILYHRLNLQEKEFKTKTFNNVSFKSFKSKSKDYLICKFLAYINPCKDAIEKNYLGEFYLYFIDSATKNILEYYKFSFTYHGDKQNKDTPQQEDLTQTTCDLLEALNDLCHHRKFEKEVETKVELAFFEDTPQDYELPFFRNIDKSESLMLKLNKSGNHRSKKSGSSAIIGSVSTGFHTLRVRGPGKIFKNDENENVNPEENQNECQNISGHEADHLLVENQKNSQKEKNDEISNMMTEDLPEEIDITFRLRGSRNQESGRDFHFQIRVEGQRRK